ncbi:family 20 glycosylhydrolase [Spirochaetota bacterium]
MPLFKRKIPAVPVRGVHLDLKGLPPKAKRLLEILDIASSLRINCILVEWEDMYPWKAYPELKNSTAYSENTVKAFLKKAAKLKIDIIPLVQSFGHLETLLRQKRFLSLRETPDDISNLCPSNPNSVPTIKALIDDILRTHNGQIRYFHLGGDEVRSLGTCTQCREAVHKRGKSYLYLKHIMPLLEYIKNKGLRPILWDDMMRSWNVPSLKWVSLLTDLMVWEYSASPSINVGEGIIDKYLKSGMEIWAASAFKGGNYMYADIPNVSVRIENNIYWADAVKKKHMKGMIATGWSRYATHWAPCESLESSWDTFAAAALIMWDGRSSGEEFILRARSVIKSGKLKSLIRDPFAACRGASEEIDRWKRDNSQLSEWIRSLSLHDNSPFTGEKNKKIYRKQFALCIEKGKKILKKWHRAHSRFVPGIWLDEYVRSRIQNAELELNDIAEKYF